MSNKTDLNLFFKSVFHFFSLPWAPGDNHISHSTELPFNLILNGIGEVVGLMDMHLWIDEDMKIDVDVVSTTSAPDLMALFHSLNGEDLPLDLLELEDPSEKE